MDNQNGGIFKQVEMILAQTGIYDDIADFYAAFNPDQANIRVGFLAACMAAHGIRWWNFPLVYWVVRAQKKRMAKQGIPLEATPLLVREWALESLNHFHHIPPHQAREFTIRYWEAIGLVAMMVAAATLGLRKRSFWPFYALTLLDMIANIERMEGHGGA